MAAERKVHWEEVYRQRDEKRVSWYQSKPEPSLGLIEKFPGAASKGIVDIGAGASRLADALFDAGYDDITLLDVSGQALQMTAGRLSAMGRKPDLVTADITEWQPRRKWGVWHDRAVFHFLTRSIDQEAYIKALLEGTAAGSIVVMGTFSPEGPEKCSGLPVQRYSAESLATRLGQAFELIESLAHRHQTPAGAEQKFMFAVFRRC